MYYDVIKKKTASLISSCCKIAAVSVNSSSSEIKKIVNDYSDVKIGVLGSHSALEVMDGAKDENFETNSIHICKTFDTFTSKCFINSG